MGAVLRPSAVAPSDAAVTAAIRQEGLSAHGWGNGPGEHYDWHRHDYDKVLYCVRGGIVFHTADGDLRLAPGDRLEIDAGTSHAASVGPDGVRCLEAQRTP